MAATDFLEALKSASEVEVAVKRSGVWTRRPVWFVVDGNTIYLLPVHGTDTKWYTHFVANPEIELSVKGKKIRAQARTLLGSSLWETFRKRHTGNVAVYWPGQPEPTRGIHDHDAEAVEFFKIFPDNHLVNNPYKILFGQGDYTCSVAEFTGTMKGPMKSADGTMIPPTNKKFHIEFCTVATWKNGAIVEERLNYDLMGMLKQIGVM